MTTILQCFVKDESGVTAIEYGLIAGLVACVIIGAVTAAGTSLNGVWTTISGALGTVTA